MITHNKHKIFQSSKNTLKSIGLYAKNLTSEQFLTAKESKLGQSSNLRKFMRKDRVLKISQNLEKKDLPFFNRSFDKKRLKFLFSWYYANKGESAAFFLIETLQKLGFTYAMRAGISLGVDDLKVPFSKSLALTQANESLNTTKVSVKNGDVTALEEFQQFVDTWHRTSENLKTKVVQNFTRNLNNNSSGPNEDSGPKFLKFPEQAKVLSEGTYTQTTYTGLEQPKPLNYQPKVMERSEGSNQTLDQDVWGSEHQKRSHLRQRSNMAKTIDKFSNVKDSIKPTDYQSLKAENVQSFITSSTPSNEPQPLAYDYKVQPSSAFGNYNNQSKTKGWSKGWTNFSKLKTVNNLDPQMKSGLKDQPKSNLLESKSLLSYGNTLNPVYMMAFSGARGNLSQVRQLVGMRGLMADPQGQLVEYPIQSNFREGLTVTEYMISCYGARKGLVDTALRTAAAGYLTRRLVDVSHHQIVRFVTCGTKNGICLPLKKKKKESNRDLNLPSAWKVPVDISNKNNNLYIKENKALSLRKENEIKTEITKENCQKFKAPLTSCIGRVLAREIPGIAFRNQEIDISLGSSSILREIYETIGIYVRSPLTCRSEAGICQLCYGWSVSRNRLVGLGEAVGIIAAQSIGEPGTQLTMRTFHTGGVFSGDIMEECRAKHAGVVHFKGAPLGLMVRTAGGAIAFCIKNAGIFHIQSPKEFTTYSLLPNSLLFVRQGEKVLTGSLLAQIPNLPEIEETAGEATKTIVSNLSGEVRQTLTVNSELARIRVLAGQKETPIYFSNLNLLDETITHDGNRKPRYSGVLRGTFGNPLLAKLGLPSSSRSNYGALLQIKSYLGTFLSRNSTVSWSQVFLKPTLTPAQVQTGQATRPKSFGAKQKQKKDKGIANGRFHSKVFNKLVALDFLDKGHSLSTNQFNELRETKSKGRAWHPKGFAFFPTISLVNVVPGAHRIGNGIKTSKSKPSFSMVPLVSTKALATKTLSSLEPNGLDFQQRTNPEAKKYKAFPLKGLGQSTSLGKHALLPLCFPRPNAIHDHKGLHKNAVEIETKMPTKAVLKALRGKYCPEVPRPMGAGSVEYLFAQRQRPCLAKQQGYYQIKSKQLTKIYASLKIFVKLRLFANSFATSMALNRNAFYTPRLSEKAIIEGFGSDFSGLNSRKTVVRRFGLKAKPSTRALGLCPPAGPCFAITKPSILPRTSSFCTSFAKVLPNPRHYNAIYKPKFNQNWKIGKGFNGFTGLPKVFFSEATQKQREGSALQTLKTKDSETLNYNQKSTNVGCAIPSHSFSPAKRSFYERFLGVETFGLRVVRRLAIVLATLESFTSLALAQACFSGARAILALALPKQSQSRGTQATLKLVLVSKGQRPQLARKTCGARSMKALFKPLSNTSIASPVRFRGAKILVHFSLLNSWAKPLASNTQAWAVLKPWSTTFGQVLGLATASAPLSARLGLWPTKQSVCSAKSKSFGQSKARPTQALTSTKQFNSPKWDQRNKYIEYGHRVGLDLGFSSPRKAIQKPKKINKNSVNLYTKYNDFLGVFKKKTETDRSKKSSCIQTFDSSYLKYSNIYYRNILSKNLVKRKNLNANSSPKRKCSASALSLQSTGNTSDAGTLFDSQMTISLLNCGLWWPIKPTSNIVGTTSSVTEQVGLPVFQKSYNFVPKRVNLRSKSPVWKYLTPRKHHNLLFFQGNSFSKKDIFKKFKKLNLENYAYLFWNLSALVFIKSYFLNCWHIRFLLQIKGLTKTHHTKAIQTKISENLQQKNFFKQIVLINPHFCYASLGLGFGARQMATAKAWQKPKPSEALITLGQRTPTLSASLAIGLAKHATLKLEAGSADFAGFAGFADFAKQGLPFRPPQALATAKRQKFFFSNWGRGKYQGYNLPEHAKLTLQNKFSQQSNGLVELGASYASNTSLGASVASHGLNAALRPKLGQKTKQSPQQNFLKCVQNFDKKNWVASRSCEKDLGQSKNQTLSIVAGARPNADQILSAINIFYNVSSKIFGATKNLSDGLKTPNVIAKNFFKDTNSQYGSVTSYSFKKIQNTNNQKSGEFFPIQGNTSLNLFKKKYPSYFVGTKEVCFKNKNILTHFDRVSYKLVLKHAIGFADVSESQITPDLFGPQIGCFINIGDELLKDHSSAYCGQIIEKSSSLITLRLTENILYSNLRFRPARVSLAVQDGNWLGKGTSLVTLPYISSVTGDIVAGIPKIEQLFEARGEALEETIDKIWFAYRSAFVPFAKAVRECFKEIGLFVVEAIQNVYSSQGVQIADKHLEVIVRQMTRRALIIDPGDTEFLPDEFVDLHTIECVNWTTYGVGASYRPRLIGITKASLTSNSFLSSASFQQTARVLERETFLEKTDRLLGLKERVMMGALIDAGTGGIQTEVFLSKSNKSLSKNFFKKFEFFSRRKIEQTRENNLNIGT